MRTTLFVAFIVIVAVFCTSCHTESVIKLGMTENEVMNIMKSNDCEEAMSQALNMKLVDDEFVQIIDHYFELPDKTFVHFDFDVKTLNLAEITYLGEYQKDRCPKFNGCFDPAQSVDLKEVNIADYK